MSYDDYVLFQKGQSFLVLAFLNNRSEIHNSVHL